ncbi:hypothetical protein CYMTET_36700 [Cymbomonas tetramitiformis]|uniref:Pseudouridine synthase RsuA/RluA-like domain-containing protein n=1 Tax=Cymbomonas tetramitiformis TaxID=36881 RepID=A0AAE0CFG8_9CHLO|nr:hypothetical protein CYMTET_36700 [Cymbomonas tetramitiformis]
MLRPSFRFQLQHRHEAAVFCCPPVRHWTGASCELRLCETLSARIHSSQKVGALNSPNIPHRLLTTASRSRQPWRAGAPLSTAKRSEDGNIKQTYVIQLHKPAGLVTSRVGQHGGSTVYDHLNASALVVSPKEASVVIEDFSEWHCIGRLDKATSGLLLLTNDGRLVHHVTNPEAHKFGSQIIRKTYVARCMGILLEETLQQLRDGVELSGGLGKSRPAEVALVAHDSSRTTVLRITVGEGKNRQVRRMLHAVGSGVLELKRTEVGGLHLEDGTAETGSWRLLEDHQVAEHLGYKPRQLEVQREIRQQVRAKLKHAAKSKRRGRR